MVERVLRGARPAPIRATVESRTTHSVYRLILTHTRLFGRRQHWQRSLQPHIVLEFCVLFGIVCSYLLLNLLPSRLKSFLRFGSRISF